MHVISVIPLSKQPFTDHLSYYSSLDYPLGTVVTVPVRSSEVPAIVVKSEPASKTKAALRAATFSLKKLEPQTNAVTLPNSIVTTAKTLEALYPTKIGALLYHLLPPDIRTGVRDYPRTTCQDGQEDTTPVIYTGLTADRFLAYKSKIREAFAHRASVLFVVPNSASVPEVAKRLQSGIEKRVITFSSTHTKKQISVSYELFNDLSQAKLIITTPAFALLERHDLTTLIVEQCGSLHYVSRMRPYLDAREVLKTYAKVSGKSILLGDRLPATEDEIKRRDDVYHTYEEHPKRLSFTSQFIVSKHTAKPGDDFKIITDETRETIALTLNQKRRVFVYAARKGLAPLITCYDCGYVFRCPDSGAPFSLYRTYTGGEEQRWFICGTSGVRVRASDTCPECNSWRLKEYGVGIQQLEDELKSTFSAVPVIRFDAETASTHKKATTLSSSFYESKSTVLVGTAMSLPYLTKPVATTVISSYEALRATPTWRAEETALATLLSIREITTNDCIIQTRGETDQFLKIAKHGRIDEFYEDDITARQELKYPPYSYFILLSYSGTKESNEETVEHLTSLLTGYITHHYQSPNFATETITHHTLITIPSEQWPDQNIMNILRSLPPQIKIEVNPPRIV